MISHLHTLNRGTVFAFTVMLVVVSLAGVAMSNDVLGATENEAYVGTRDDGSLIAQAQPVRTDRGTSASWGIFAYTSDRGLSCLQAGMVKNGIVGSYNGKEFLPLSPRDSIGNCGELASDLKARGGVAFAAEAPVGNDVTDRSAVVYGLLADVSKVTVTLDKSSQDVPVEIRRTSEVDGADETFIAPLPPGTKLPGVTITFTLKDGRTVDSVI